MFLKCCFPTLLSINSCVLDGVKLTESDLETDWNWLKMTEKQSKWIENLKDDENLGDNHWVVTGECWTGSPNKSIHQTGKTCPKMSENCVFRLGPSGQFSDIFSTFSDILSTFAFSGLSNDLPVTTIEWLQRFHMEGEAHTLACDRKVYIAAPWKP